MFIDCDMTYISIVNFLMTSLTLYKIQFRLDAVLKYVAKCVQMLGLKIVNNVCY